MRSRVLIPIQLGCCPTAPRCLLCNPPPAVSEAKIEALVVHYRGRATAGQELVAAFFGGPPPTPAQIEAVGGLPFVARVRPDLLSRAEADRLVAAGCVGVELDALSFCDEAVRGVRRRHRARLVEAQARGLRERGLRVGLVLSPGLPGTSQATCEEDARRAAGLVHTVRLHPVLVLDRAGIREAHMDGRYTPLSLGDAVTTCRAMMDLLEGAGVEVIRVGQQPGPDELGRAVAGPAHSSLRELIESRRALDALRRLLADLPDGARVVAIRCAPADLGRVRGPRNQHVRTLRALHALDEVRVRPDPGLPRGTYAVEVA